MKRSMPVSVWVLALVIMLFHLTGCNSGTSTTTFVTPSSEGTSTTTTAAVVTPTLGDVSGIVFLNGAEAGASVSVYAPGSSTLLYATKASTAGIFRIPAGTSLPSEYVVVATLANGAQVARYAAGGERHLWVNAITHLAALYKAEHPSVAYAKALQTVQVGLGFAASAVPASLYGLSSHDASPFSHAIFLQKASLAGGFANFSQSVLDRIVAGNVVSFAAPGNLDAPLAGLKRVRVVDGLVSFVFQGVCNTLVQDIFNNAAGQVLASVGLNIGTSGALDNIQNELTAVSQQLTALGGQLLTASDLKLASGLATNLSNLYDNVTICMQDLTTVIKQGVNTQATLNTPNSVPSAVTTVTAAFGSFFSQTAIDQFVQALTSPTTSDNLSSLYAQVLSGNTKVSETIVSTTVTTNFNNVNSPASYNYYDLRDDARTQFLVDNLKYYGNQAQVINMNLVESANTTYLPQDFNVQNRAAPAPRVNSALFNICQFSDLLQGAAQQIPQLTGTDLVLIDAANGLMWYRPTQVVNYWTAQNDAINLCTDYGGFNLWYYSGYIYQCPTNAKQAATFVRSPTNGWRLPEVSELNTLYKRVKATGAGGTLQGEEALGFIGLQSGSSNYEKIWYNGSLVPSPEVDGAPAVVYYNMSNGKTDQQSFITDGAVLTELLVRSIPDPTFHDTPSQAIFSYQSALTSMTLKSKSLTVTGASAYSLTSQGSTAGGNVDLSSRTIFTVSDSPLTTFPSPPGGKPTMSTDSGTAHLVVGQPTTSGQYQDPVLYFDKAGTVYVSAFFQSSPVGGNRMTVMNVPFTSTTAAAMKTGTFPVPTASPAPSPTPSPQPAGLLVTPQNLFITVTFQTGTQQFYATEYLASGTTVDVTQQATWAVFDSSGAPVPTAQMSFIAGGLVQLGDPNTNTNFNSTLFPSDVFRITATFNGVTSYALFKVPN